MPGVFAGGDIVTGAATVIEAMGAGRRAAARHEGATSASATESLPYDDGACEHGLRHRRRTSATSSALRVVRTVRATSTHRTAVTTR